MLAFWGDNKALTARKSADCTNLFKRLRYSNRAVRNSYITATEAILLYYSSHTKGKNTRYNKQLNEDKAIRGWNIN